MSLPKPSMYDDIEDWAERLVKVLESRFASEEIEDTVGRIDIFAVSLPDTHFECDGGEFDVAAAPELARKLGETFGTPSGSGLCVLPDITPAESDTIVGIKK